MHSSRRAFLSTSLASTAYAWQASSNVLLPSDPSRSQMWAAKGLASLAPARLEIRTADLGEGFRLTTSRTSVLIEGGRDRGCLYGAMELLERVGYRWFTPEHARVPARVAIPKLDLERRPALAYREAFFTEAQDGDWSARNRLNGHFHRLEAQHGGRYFFQPWAHSFVELIPPPSFFAQHPEYFALVEGKRRADAQLCLSNPDVIRLSIQRVREWIAAHPDASAYSVSQNDNADWCECEQCASLGPTTSDRLLQFVNRIARELPDKTIDTLAYQDTRRPPRSTVPAPNVLIRFCPIEACQAHALGRCRESIDAFHDYEGWRRTAKHIVPWR